MRNILNLVFLALLLSNCNRGNNNYFKLTFTDQGNPVSLLPESIEVGSDGKLVILTNRYNKGDEIYQRTCFIELTQPQLDSVRLLIAQLPEADSLVIYDTSYHYKIKIDQIKNHTRTSSCYVSNSSNKKIDELITYCKALPNRNHRFTVNNSYYFNTDEICLEPKK